MWPKLVILDNLKHGKTNFSTLGLKDGPILLLVIKATRKEKVDEKPFVNIKDLEDSRIKEVCFFLVDANFSKLHKCRNNHENFKTIANILKSS